MIQRRQTVWPMGLLFMVAGMLTLPGCEAFNRFPGEAEIIEVQAKYLGLNDKTVAVVVSVSDHTNFNYPEARQRITGEVTRRIKVGVPGVTVTEPYKILKWQDDNPYWSTRPPSAMIEQLDVDRLVLVEIGQYRTHEPGDKYVLRGVITANINIVEAEAPDPDNYGASYSKSVMYPRAQDSTIGRAAMSEDKIEIQAQAWFCEETAGLFYDHELTR